MVGAYNFDALEPCELPKEVDTGFTGVFSIFAGAEYTPVLYCGTQDVHGINHMIICKMRICHPDATDRPVKVVLNQMPIKEAVVFKGTSKDELTSNWSIVSIEKIA
ncbi:MAG: hypothetical protein J1F02_02655 [Lachnospiraceae bacterium]|nr:hypothetical protein [Lachnospiraceae bacterium]